MKFLLLHGIDKNTCYRLAKNVKPPVNRTRSCVAHDDKGFSLQEILKIQNCFVPRIAQRPCGSDGKYHYCECRHHFPALVPYRVQLDAPSFLLMQPPYGSKRYLVQKKK